MVATIRVLILMTLICFEIFGTQVDKVSGN